MGAPTNPHAASNAPLRRRVARHARLRKTSRQLQGESMRTTITMAERSDVCCNRSVTAPQVCDAFKSIPDGRHRDTDTSARKGAEDPHDVCSFTPIVAHQYLIFHNHVEDCTTGSEIWCVPFLTFHVNTQ